MYDIDKLEQQWLRYRRKKVILWSIIGLCGCITVGATVYLANTKVSSLEVSSSMPISKKNSFSKNREVLPKKHNLQTKNMLSSGVPSLVSGQNSENLRVGQIVFQKTDDKMPNKSKKHKKILITVAERGSGNIALDIENRFEFAKDKADSLFLAKYYYDKMDYSKAEKWALETNKLDNSIEESWLIFAKAKAKQGKRVESLEVLKAFNDQSESAEAKILMDKIRRGKKF